MHDGESAIDLTCTLTLHIIHSWVAVPFSCCRRQKDVDSQRLHNILYVSAYCHKQMPWAKAIGCYDDM